MTPSAIIRRAARLIAPERTLVSVMRVHEPYYRRTLADLPRLNVVAQPVNRGTAPAILYSLMRLRAAAPSDAVVLLPSDHYVSDDDALMARVEGAMEAVWTRPEMVVLLGIAPDRPEVDYGWIEPDELMLGRWAWPLYGVRRFWAKPPIEDARRLLRRGSLWNTFMIVANPSVLEQRIRVALTALAAGFEPLRAWMATAWDEGAARIVYGRLPVGGIDWNDLGDAARVHATRSGLVGAMATS